MSGTIRRRLLKGAGANLYGQGAVAAIQIIGVPVLIHAWGLKVYGEWLVISAIPGYLSMTNLGFSISAANDMTKLVSRGARDEALAVFQSLFGFILTISGLLFCAMSVMVWRLPLGAWGLHAGVSEFAIRLTLWCLCCDIIVKLFDGLNHAGFRATGEYALHQFIYYSIILVQQSIVWAVALGGHGPGAAAFGYLVFSALAIPATAGLLRWRHSWLTFGLGAARLSELRRLAGPALGNLAGTLSGSLSIQGTTLLVGAFLGPIQVVTLSTQRTMTRLAVVMVSVVTMASEPEFAGLGESPDKARLLGLFGKIISICFWLSAGVASGLAVAGPWLLALWTHGRVAMDYPLFCWLLATVVSQTMWNGSLALLRGRNEHMSATLFQVATTLCAMGLSAASLAMFHRLWTVGLALFMMDIVFLGFVLRQIHVRYGIRLKQLVYSTLDPGPILMILTSRKYS